MFKVGVPVFFEDFVGRKEELKLLKFYLTKCVNQSIMIHAPRRFGKTSLIKESFRIVQKENKYLLYFDLKHYSSLRSFGQDILNKLYELFEVMGFWESMKSGVISFLKNIKPKLSLHVYKMIELTLEPVEKITQETDDVDFFLKCLDVIQLVAIKSKIDLKVAFDEFQDIFNLTNDEKITDKLRSTIQHQSNVAYLFCGSQESLMNTIFLDKRSGLFNFARIITLGPLEMDELAKHIIKKFKLINVQVEVDELNIILDELECHPYYSMKTMQVLHSIVLGDSVQQVSLLMLQKALDLAYLETKSYLEDLINYVKNKAHHFEVLLCLAKEAEINLDPLNGYRVKQSLVNMGLIKVISRGQYVIIDSFLRKYLLGIN